MVEAPFGLLKPLERRSQEPPSLTLPASLFSPLFVRDYAPSPHLATSGFMSQRTFIKTYVYAYMYLCICVCVCICEHVCVCTTCVRACECLIQSQAPAFACVSASSAHPLPDSFSYHVWGLPDHILSFFLLSLRSQWDLIFVYGFLSFPMKIKLPNLYLLPLTSPKL